MMPRPVRGSRLRPLPPAAATLSDPARARPPGSAFAFARRFAAFSRSSSAFGCAMVKTTNFASGVKAGAVPRGVLEFLAGAQVADDELAVVTLRRRGVGEPLPVVRQPRALDRFPVVDDVVGQRAFPAARRLGRQRPLEREQRAGDDDDGAAARGLVAWRSLLQVDGAHSERRRAQACLRRAI